jgi:hypothetical protein
MNTKPATANGAELVELALDAAAELLVDRMQSGAADALELASDPGYIMALGMLRSMMHSEADDAEMALCDRIDQYEIQLYGN